MPPYARSFLTAAVLLASANLWAQEVFRVSDSDLLARFSYDSSAVVQKDDADRRICMAVSRSGDYRIVRLMKDGETLRLRGKISEEQFKQLQSLLEASEFRSLSGVHGGLIRQESESFGAEIRRGESKTQRMHWLTADGDSPFPDPIAKVVDWLKRFDAKNGTPFDYADYPDVCPAGGLRLLQPSVAANEHP